MNFIATLFVAALLATACTSMPFYSRYTAPIAMPGFQRYKTSSNVFHPTANPMARFALPAFRDTTATHFTSREETPLLTYFTPTFKCPGGYYCRAEMTAYKEFQGMTSVVMGYSVWSFASPSEPIPSSAINSILATTDEEIRGYVSVLAPLIYEHYPYQSDLCPVSYPEAIAAFRKAIESMASCTKTENFVCERDASAGRCE